MNEKIVEYNVALFAKNKGFNLESLYYYTIIVNNNKSIKNNKDRNNIVLRTNKHREFVNHNNIKKFNRISAPTQSLLQKWLRKQGIRVEVDSLIDASYSYSIYRVESNSRYAKQLIFEYTDQYSYETALELGLEKALKIL